MATNLIHELDKTVAETTQSLAMGEDVRYGVTLTAVPGPPEQPVQVLALVVVSIPSFIIGQRYSSTLMFPQAEPDVESVQDAVKTAIEQMRAGRSEGLSEPLKAI